MPYSHNCPLTAPAYQMYLYIIAAMSLYIYDMYIEVYIYYIMFVVSIPLFDLMMNKRFDLGALIFCFKES